MKRDKAARRRALVMDDDPSVLELISFLLEGQFPDLEVVCRREPDLTGEFDVYLIDNDFNGHLMATELVESIRRSDPASLVIVCSAQLDVPVLKRLINAGCEGAYDKCEPRELNEMLDTIATFLSRPPIDPPARPSATNIVQLVTSITTLIHEWNRRLTIEDARKF